MTHSRRIQFRCLLMLASFVFSVGVMMPLMSGTSFAKSTIRLRSATPSAKSWNIVSSPNQSSNNDNLSGVAAVSASDVWAVGTYFGSGGNPHTLIEQWNGSSWSIVASPNQGIRANLLSGVAAVSASDVWAVGEYADSNTIRHTLIEHWNGRNWSIVTSPNQGTNNNQLYGVVGVSVNDIWAVGYYLNSSGIPQTLVEHWNGTSWSIVASPNLDSINDALTSVVAVSTSNIWAVGYANTQTLVEHWNGTSWSIVASPNQGTNVNRLYGVTVSSASDIWAVGYYSTSSGAFQTLIEQWNGTSWSIVASPNNGSSDVVLSGVARVSSNNIWAVGAYSNSSGIQQTLIEHWNGTSWSIVASPNLGSIYDVLSGVAWVSGSSNVWAVGAYSPSSIGQTSTLIEYYG